MPGDSAFADVYTSDASAWPLLMGDWVEHSGTAYSAMCFRLQPMPGQAVCRGVHKKRTSDPYAERFLSFLFSIF